MPDRNDQNTPELWGGLECTINRVGDDFFDQFEMANLYEQPKQEAIASLGIRKLRFPVLWERHQPHPDTVIDWTYTNEQLEGYRSKGITPVATLVHHGSGPRFTSLADPLFPELLARYAKQVAERFPWLEYYTPVNEPLTTARFSGLYGLWYPHGTDDKTFLQCLIHELKGTVLAMEEIRRINPAARLIQTEDLGKTYSTPALAYQAQFENQRRWLTYDLLCGQLNPAHPLWNYLLANGIEEEQLRFFAERPCVPDIFGFNYYVTSERYLDEHLEHYPQVKPGGNGRQRYVDVEAARVPMEASSGVQALLREAWERYQRPMAVTEVHLHCHREEQLRWFRYVFDTCIALRAEGVDIRAVTGWALLGSFGWNRLLTGAPFDYEPGAFDLRGSNPRETALAGYLRSLPEGKPLQRQLAGDKGWWQRDSRFLRPCPAPAPELRHRQAAARRPILIIGKRGTLGRALARVCSERSLDIAIAGRDDCDIADPVSIAAAINRVRPWAIINAAGYVRVDEAETDELSCHRDNAEGPAQLARACASAGIRLVSYSSDLVFDGRKEGAYLESDRVNPLNAYGRSKARAEQEVLTVHPDALMVRSSAFFGPWDPYNFLYWVESRLREGSEVPVASDLLVSPTYVPELVHTTLDLLIDGEKGIWHLANKGSFSWADLAGIVADEQGLDRSLLRPRSSEDMGYTATRPRNSVLGSEKGSLLPDTSDAFHRYFAERRRFAGQPD